MFILLLVTVVSAAWSLETKTFDGKTIPEHHRKASSNQSEYVCKGFHWNILENMDMYETRENNSTRILIFAYDIFGYSPNVFRVSDMLAEAGGFRVVMPDFFRGDPFPSENFPPKDFSLITKFIEGKGSWEMTRTVILKVIEHFKGKFPNATFGILGPCWGGKIVVQAASDPSLPFKAGAALHPVFVETSEANQVGIPLYLFPSHGEPDMLPFYEIIKKRFGDNCGHKRYDDMPHGFTGGLGNFADPANFKAVNEVYGIIQTFFSDQWSRSV